MSVVAPPELVVLVPDAHWNAVIGAILERPSALGIRPVRARPPIVHPLRGPGVRTTGVDVLASRASLRPDACQNSSYRAFVEALRRWFPAEPPR